MTTPKTDIRPEEGAKTAVKVVDRGAAGRLGINASAEPCGGFSYPGGLCIVDGRGSFILAGGAAASHLASTLLRGVGKSSVISHDAIKTSGAEAALVLLLPPGLVRDQAMAAPTDTASFATPASLPQAVRGPVAGETPSGWLDIVAPGWRQQASAITSLAATDPAWASFGSSLFGAAPMVEPQPPASDTVVAAAASEPAV